MRIGIGGQRPAWGIAPRQHQYRCGDCGAVQQHIGLIECTQRAQGQLPDIAAAGADEQRHAAARDRVAVLHGQTERLLGLFAFAAFEQAQAAKKEPSPERVELEE